MSTEIPLELRQAVMRLTLGKPSVVRIADMEPAAIAEQAVRFGRLKRIGVHAKPVADGSVMLTRIEFTASPNLYPELDALEVGQFHVFDLPVALHQRIRLAASNRQRQGRGAFTCSREGDKLRVTRLPATDAERAACGPLQVPARVTKYDLERLGATRELRFTVPRADEAKLRLAAHRQGIKTGWSIRCRRQDDGSMLIYRTDMPAADTGSDSAAQ